MEPIREALAPLTDWIPPPYHGWFPVEVWWLFGLVAALSALVAVGYLLRALLRASWRMVFPPKPFEWDAGLVEDLTTFKPESGPPSLLVRHAPGWLRYVVAAPAGKQGKVTRDNVLPLLERVLPGITAVLWHDRPRIDVWPMQLSAAGFANTFHRSLPLGKEEREGEPAEWVLLAGKAQGGGQTLFVGLAIKTREKTTLGRMNLEPHQWLDVLRLVATGAPT